MQSADHLPGREVQGGVQARGAVSFVVVRGALGGAGEHWQDRPGAIKRLDLRLLIDCQDHGPLGRVQVQADDVTDLRDELRIARELPFLMQVRLEPERCPDVVHRGLREPDLPRHRPASTSASRPSAWTQAS